MEPILVARPAKIEEGLRVVQNQFPTDTGPMDLLGADDEGAAVVVELKDEIDDGQLAQGIRYYDWVRRNIAWLAKSHPIINADLTPRLFLIAPGFSPELKRLAQYTTLNSEGLLELKRYVGLLLPGGEKDVICLNEDIGEAPEPPDFPTVEEKVQYIEDASVKALFAKALRDLESKGVRIKPIGGHTISGFHAGRLVLRLKTRKRWFLGKSRLPDGSWTENERIATDDDWRAFAGVHVAFALDGSTEGAPVVSPPR